MLDIETKDNPIICNLVMITYAILYIKKSCDRRVYKLLCCYVGNPTDNIHITII